MSSPPAYTLEDCAGITADSPLSINECLDTLFGQRMLRATLLRAIVILAAAIVAIVLLGGCWYFNAFLSLLISNAGGLLKMVGTVMFCINIMVAGYLVLWQ